MTPTTGEVNDFDFDLHFDTKALGASSKNISVKGTYKNIEFTCKVEKAELLYAMTKRKLPTQGPGIDFESLVWDMDKEDFAIDLSSFTATGGELTDDDKKSIAARVKTHMLNYKKGFQGGNNTQIPNLDKLPMDSVFPMALIYYGSNFAESVTFEEPFINFGASVQHFGLLTEKQKGMLKPLKN